MVDNLIYMEQLKQITFQCYISTAAGL